MKRICLIFIILSVFSCRKSDYLLDSNTEALNDYGEGIGTKTLKKDHNHLFEGFIFVNDGQVLTIEPGTILRFKAGKSEKASALIVARGGKIIANGTKDEPIVFTSEKDDLKGSVADGEHGLWGGLIILGNAPVNTTGGEQHIEGIPLAEPRGVFGGPDENDNSGILRYVSIRHGGTDIGEGNEINGLTLGGVGRNTLVDYVEVVSNSDDGIEIFGGAVNLKHIAVSNCDDDAFDYDLGWSGNGQFWLGVQSDGTGDKLIEAGGGTNPVEGLPYSLPRIFNTTLIGNGTNSQGPIVAFEKNAGGVIAGSIIINKARGVELEVTDLVHDSYSQWKNKRLGLPGNIFYLVGNSTPETIFNLSGFSTQSMKNDWASYFNTSRNQVSDPKIDWKNKNYIPLQKITGTPEPYPNTWFQAVDFKGAFGGENWIKGWSLLGK
jgi:hypothetical protein